MMAAPFFFVCQEEFVKTLKGVFANGLQEVRVYWTERWSEINPHVEPASFHP